MMPSQPLNLDLSKLRISQNYLETGGPTEKIFTSIPVRRPDRQEFIRVHSDPAFKFQTYVMETKEDRSVFLIDPEIWEQVHDLAAPKALMTCMTRQGVLFLWPIKLPGSDGRSDRWSESALLAAKHAENDWVRVSANMSAGGYDVFKALAALPDPKWPELSMDQIVTLAFRDRYINDLGHDVLRRLRGEI